MSTVILLAPDANSDQVARALTGLGLWPKAVKGPEQQVEAFTLATFSQHVTAAEIATIEGVMRVLESPSAHPKLDARAGVQAAIPLKKHGVLRIGGDLAPVLAAGPCAAESEEQVHRCAELVHKAGGRLLRGGAYKPRTAPYSFSGFGQPALEWLRTAADAYGLGLVTEVMSERHVDAVAEAADLIQVGSRNMQNFALLRAIGGAKKPVLLKRGAAAELDEWRLAAEHLLHAGATDVIFCARGVRGPTDETRYVLDLGAVALLKHVDGHKVFVDPSHAAGRRDLILPLAQAALAAGADGLLVETHPDASQARSDGAQALSPRQLLTLGQRFESTVRAA